MKSIISLLKLGIILDSRSTKTSSKIIYYMFNFFIAFLIGGIVFLILFSDINTEEGLNAFLNIVFFFIFFLIFIFNLIKYISRTAINIKKINHFPIHKEKIYYSFLISDLLSFRNFFCMIIIIIISIFLITNYDFYGFFSIIFIILYFFFTIIWIRNFFIIFDNFLSKTKIRNNLVVLIIFLGIIVYILALIGEQFDIENNPSKFISIFTYLPFGWAGNGIINLISESFFSAFLYLFLLLIFNILGIKCGIVLMKRKEFY